VNRKELILVLFLLTCFTFFVQWSGAEQRSFFNLILAVHNDHSLQIDPYESSTPDKAFYDGHYYSDKAPGLSFMGVPVYAAINRMQNLARPGLLLPYIIYMVSAFVVSLPAALLSLFILRFLRRLGFGEAQAIVVTLVMALGTLAFPFSTLFFSHQTAAFFVFAAFYLLFVAKTGQAAGRKPARLLFGAGLLVGVSVLVEYPMALMAIVLLFYAVTCVSDKKTASAYIAGGVLPALLLMAYNYAAFGSPLRFSYFYEANTWAQVHQTGFLGLGMPQLDTFVTVLVGARGLFTLSPVLLLAVYGLWMMIRSREWRAEGVLFAVSFAIYLMMTSGYKVPPTDIWTPGPRFLVPVLPLLAAPLAFAARRWRWLFAALAALSVAIMFLLTAANPQVPPEVANPLLHYWLPGFLDRSQLVNTLPALRFGISKGLSVLMLGGAVGVAGLGVLCTWLARRNQRRQSLVLAAFAVVMVVIYLTLAFPINVLDPFDVPASLTGKSGAAPTAAATSVTVLSGDVHAQA
jgi:4-amino-4-deoxy-L-arabinose transferase-like glycosyltransferase